MSLYYSSPFADGGFLDQLQESVVDADERVPLTQPEGVLPAPTSTQTHGVSTAEVPLPQKQAPDKLGFPRAPANPRHFEVLSVVRNLSEDSSPPPPPPAVPFSNPPPPQHLSLSHADADDPILAALHSQSTQQSSSFYSQPIPLPLTSPPTPPLQSTHTTGRYADTTPSTSFSLPARIEPGLDEFKDKVGEGWNFVKGWVTEKGREVRETVNARQSLPTTSTPSTATSTASRSSFFGGASDPPLVQSNVVVPPSRGPVRLLCACMCGLCKKFVALDFYVKQIVLLGTLGVWVVFKLRW